MKKLILSIAAIAVFSLSSFAQTPEGFKYQAVVRDAGNIILTNQSVGFQLTILQTSPDGTVVYTETFAATTNDYGLVNLEIGTGTTTDDFSMIDWSAGPYFIETAIDNTGGMAYSVMGTSQLMSVPYALYALNAENVANDMIDDADADPTNELQDWASLPNIPADIADGDDVDDADADPTNELQDWASLPNIPADIADGDDVDDADADSTNEIQSLSLSGSDLTISGGNTVTLPDVGVTGSGTSNYMTKFTSGNTIGDSQLRDDGIGLAVGTTPNSDYMLYLYETQLTADGDGQSSLMARRTRDSQNDGTGYGYSVTNTAVKGYNYWGDVYTFGVGGFSYNDYTRTGGVIGAYQGGTYWGSLGYKNSASATFGVYATSALTVGTGLLPTSAAIGIGGGFFGDLVGSTSQGAVIGQLNSGDLFAQYNKGNVYTLGKNVELVKTNESITPVYSVSSVEATIYAKGSAQLTNGTAYIEFTNEYKTLLGENPIITATPNGECNGVYISSVDKNGFTITELMSGSSDATISWISVGNRIDNDKMDLATQIVSASTFDRNVQQVLYSDGNIEGSAKGMWWDGTTIQFGAIPAHLTNVESKD